MKPWKRARSTPPPGEPLSPPGLVWLLVTLTLAVLLHAGQVPIWLVLGFLALAGWRAAIVWYSWSLPAPALRLLLALLAAGAVLAHYKTLLGRDAGVALLAAMAACKLLETRDLRDGVVLVFLGYLLVMGKLLYSQDIPVVAGLLGVVLLLLTAQMMLHRQHAGLSGLAPLRLAGRMMLLALPVMLILFVLFPRIPGPLWGLPKDAYQGRTGLSDEMTPGTISELIQSGAVAFRVRFNGALPPPAQRYWRGPVLEQFDGRRWTAAHERPVATLMPFTPLGPALDYAVILEPSNQRWLLALDLPARLPPGALMTQAFQLLRSEPVNEVYRYELRSYPQYRTGELSAAERARALQLPARGNSRARMLAADWQQADAQPEARVNRALALFREQPFYYTLKPALLGVDGVDDFLFRSREGFCEHYASAFVFLMRAAGVPARVVTGYLGGEPGALGDYLIVRQSDAHAWAEVWLEERGWVRIDPTAAVAPNRVRDGVYAAVTDPGGLLPFLARRGGDLEWLRQLALGWDALNIAWNEWVLAYGPQRQRDFLSGLGFGEVDWEEMILALLLALSVLGLVYAGLRWQSRRERDPVARAWQQVCKRLARRGLVRGGHEGPLDFSERVAAARPDLAEAIRALGQHYAALRYGPAASPEQVRQLQRQVRHLRL